MRKLTFIPNRHILFKSVTDVLRKSVTDAPTIPVVGADGLLQEREAELLRAIADALDCQIPPFVEITES